MITHKSSIAKKPFKGKYSLRKSDWYLFPQRWTWRKSVAEINYDDDGVYKHSHFWLIYAYHFTWLFIDYHWELNTDERLSTSRVRHEPIKYIAEDGHIFGLNS